MKIPSAAVVKKFIVPIIAGIVIVACMVTFALRFSMVSTLESSIATSQQSVRTMQRNIQNSENLEEQLAEIETLTDEIMARAIEPKDTAVNTAYFYQFETDGLKIETVEQRASATAKGDESKGMNNFGTALFNIRAEGNFHEIMDFVFHLRKGEKIVRVVDFTVSPTGQAGGKTRQISVTLEALTQLPEKE